MTEQEKFYETVNEAVIFIKVFGKGLILAFSGLGILVTLKAFGLI